MAFFGFALKRKASTSADNPRSARSGPVDEIEDASFVVSRPGAEEAHAGVEVVEIALDACDFESTFGAASHR